MADKNFKVKTGLTLPSPLPADQGGTGQTSTTNSLNALLPLQTSNSGKVLSTDGTSTSWVAQAVAYQRGGTASRPASPSAGDLYYNTDYNYFESYTANGWFPIAASPGIPTGVTATNQGTSRAFNNGQMSVAFTPATTGGAPTSLIVTPSPATSPTTFTGSTSPIIVTGLSSSTSYTYTVSATSPYGTSAASSASSGVTATSVPQAPTIGAATAGNASASVAYTAGATGGATVTTYTATSSPGSLTGTGSSPITVSGLTNGTAYTFTVTATNANGTSTASSASSSVTPANDPFITSGGTDISNETHFIRKFTGTANLVLSSTRTIDYLVVAGGGSASGGWGSGGGGGAGGMRTGTVSVPSGTYLATIGAGGIAIVTNGTYGGNGVNSTLALPSAITSIGGGTGGSYQNGGGPYTCQAGVAGGSGGGGGNIYSGSTPQGGAGTSGQGNAGGAGGQYGTNTGGGGGGGGAGAAGANCTNSTAGGIGGNGGNGGIGLQSSITGTATYYAGGGGGGTGQAKIQGLGGAGGGGNATGDGARTGLERGVANTGGGGGATNAGEVSSGGSGIIIVRTLR